MIFMSHMSHPNPHNRIVNILHGTHTLKKTDVLNGSSPNETTHAARRLFVRDSDDASVWWDVGTGTLCDAEDVAAMRADGVECVLMDG